MKANRIQLTAGPAFGALARVAVTAALLAAGLGGCTGNDPLPTGPLVTCEFHSPAEACNRVPQDPM